MRNFITDNAKINFLKSSKFIEKEFKNDKENLISFYESKGYRDIKIIDEDIVRNGDYVDIELRVDPGRKYYFRNINWTGNYIYNKEILNEVLAISKGDVYDTETLEKKLPTTQKDLMFLLYIKTTDIFSQIYSQLKLG